jgi:hypothetical protein
MSCAPKDRVFRSEESLPFKLVLGLESISRFVRATNKRKDVMCRSTPSCRCRSVGRFAGIPRSASANLTIQSPFQRSSRPVTPSPRACFEGASDLSLGLVPGTQARLAAAASHPLPRKTPRSTLDIGGPGWYSFSLPPDHSSEAASVERSLTVA